MMVNYRYMMDPPFWYRALVRVQNGWKNLSVLWSSKEQRLQAAMIRTLQEFDAALVAPDHDFSEEPEEDICFIGHIPTEPQKLYNPK